jgi:hypothetical protein
MILIKYILLKNIHLPIQAAGVSVAEWERSLTSNLLDFKPSPLLVRIPTGTFDSFTWGSYPASLLNVGGSTQVPIHAWNNARKGAWGLPSPVKLECRDMTYSVSMWRKIQNKQNHTDCRTISAKQIIFTAPGT